MYCRDCGGLFTTEGVFTTRCFSCTPVGQFIQRIPEDDFPKTWAGVIEKRTNNLMLISRRGRRVRDYAGRCRECREVAARLLFHRSSTAFWSYRESTWGTVVVCSQCRDKVLERSFGSTCGPSQIPVALRG